MSEKNLFTMPIADIEKAVGFDPSVSCIFCEQPVGALSMGGPLICPACDCGHYRHDYAIERLRGKPWNQGHDWAKFYTNARRRMSALAVQPESQEG
jgi:hypothetical protein